LAEVAAQVSAHPGVSHNYARPHHYNLWFTLAVPPGRQVEAEVHRLARQTGVDDWLNLPALRVFKIRTHFGLGASAGYPGAVPRDRTTPQSRDLLPADIPYVRALQGDLPLVSRPFAGLAERSGLSEAALLDRARELEAAGIMRRFGAVLRHRRVGYVANGMACWVVPEPRVEAVGRLAARYAQVSHCYQRPAYPPRWPYTLFTMIHGRTRSQGRLNSIDSRCSTVAGSSRKNEFAISRRRRHEPGEVQALAGCGPEGHSRRREQPGAGLSCRRWRTAFHRPGKRPLSVGHGDRYVDYVLSWGPLILGHAHPVVVEALCNAAARGTSYGAPTALETELAELVIEMVPSVEMVRFVNSGTEATMSALRLARAYTGCHKIVKFEGCYHGHGDMLLVQAGSGVATLGLPDSPGVPPGAAQDTLTAPFNNLSAVEALFQQFPDEIAAVILEPVAGTGRCLSLMR